MWGIGEVGIALDWQSRDQEFEPPILHQKNPCLSAGTFLLVKVSENF